MSWFYKFKRHFLIKLISALGFGGTVAFCIVGCDTKPANNAEEQKTSPEETTDAETQPKTDAETATQDAEVPANPENPVPEQPAVNKDNTPDSAKADNPEETPQPSAPLPC